MSKDWDYANHSHEVSQHGGVEKYNEDLVADGRKIGHMDMIPIIELYLL